ncbi:transposase [Trinickia mobilis]|uniref:transposase n=1 Tax=Trinickia mobilis TaxID=2816356 RepID=UPI001F5C9BA7|nr:transposase [Trinickia mobilis]
MQSTTQTRLYLASRDAQTLGQMAALHGSMKRKLYARIAARGGKAKSHKTAFCRDHSISARMFNAIAIELQGLLDSARELLGAERKDLLKAIRRQQGQLDARRERLAEIAADRLRMHPQREAKLRHTVRRNGVALARLQAKLVRVERRLAANVPGICFGTRKLFSQQHHLALTGFRGRDAWLKAWRDSRSHQVSFVGSKGETAGNQLCQLRQTADGHYQLRVRVPDCLRSRGERKYLVINSVTFNHDGAALDEALHANVALTWRLHWDGRHWRAFVAFDHAPARRVTLGAQYGVVGIDFNVDHLAATETDPSGNLISTRRFALLREDATSGQREAVLSDALSKAVAWAKEELKPVVAEGLDFTAKKKAMARLSPKGARMLSGLLYAKYRQLLEAKCFRAGVELILIDPAYTSTIGAVKYAARRGWSVHASAAGVIARRGQKLTERLPRAGTVLRVPVRGGHHALELPARKSRDSRVAAWRSVHAAYRGVVRERWLATRGGSPHRSAKGTAGMVQTPCPSAGTTATPATKICTYRFVHH